MPVYMIQVGQDGPVKIGVATDVEKRLGELQIGCPYELRIFRVFEGAEAEERILHDRFADLWLRGEWHSWSRAMAGDIGLAEIVAEPELPIMSAPTPGLQIGERIAKARRRVGLSQRGLANILSVAPSAVAQWESGATTVKLDRIADLASAIGVSPAWLINGQMEAA